jgi:hypothetical protein
MGKHWDFFTSDPKFLFTGSTCSYAITASSDSSFPNPHAMASETWRFCNLVQIYRALQANAAVQGIDVLSSEIDVPRHTAPIQDSV